MNAVLPKQQQLRLQNFDVDVRTSLWDPDIYSLGVYETGEASFLTSATVTSLYRLAQRGLLQPRNVGVKVWAFRDLVAVRTWRYLRSLGGQRVSSKVVPALAQFAGDKKAVRLGATSDGHVLVDHGDGWFDLMSGEGVLDLPVTDVDNAFRPFEFGDRTAPDLLQSSEHTLLHPAVLHGTPYLAGHRISARALAMLDDRGGRGAILAAYPELSSFSLDDTIAIGHQLIRVR
jgi:uncharacterized protein (DUF433 family)